MRLSGFAGILFALVLLAVAAHETSAQDRISLGITTKTGSTGLPFVIAEEKGGLIKAVLAHWVFSGQVFQRCIADGAEGGEVGTAKS